MHAHETAIELVALHQDRDLAEADTRLRILDPILLDVLGWPRIRIDTEKYVRPGYADYVLTRSDGGKVLLIEAKREGAYFALPQSLRGSTHSGHVRLRTLLTDPQVADAINQARTYCLDIGCDVAAITNGHEWVFFRTFQRDADWRELRAFVVFSLTYFSERFVEAHNHLSFDSITQRGSLRRLLLDQSIHHRELFYPKSRVPSYDAIVNANAYASSLRPIADRYFGVIDASDVEFMDQCYVHDREYDQTFANARRRLEDSITPYLEQFGIQDFKDSEQGGAFGNRLKRSALSGRAPDVVVLFGGKGVGKSTFLKRLLFHRPPAVLSKHSIVAIVDLLLNIADLAHIREQVWRQVVDALDTDPTLTSTREALCKLFADRFDAATRIDLFGIDTACPEYNLRLNDLIAKWKQDLPYFAARLATVWRMRHRVFIVVIDNTDQFPEAIQESCFAIAQEVSRTLNCMAVISMREERFYSSSIHGVLDAYQNSGFHITSPEPTQVFLRRIDYVMRLLRAEHDELARYFPTRVDVDIASKLFRVVHAEFAQNEKSHLAQFLSACSHGNIRLALELFRGFLVSGYTNVHEMTQSDWWKLQIHQVIKPFMIPERFFYDEQYSLIPNLFQIRSKSLGSHFTALRILRRLIEGQDGAHPPFIPIAKLLAEFVESYGMREDFQLNADLLLKHGLVEANNRIDSFTDDVDAVKITSYGVFMLRFLTKRFSYLELVSLDCAIGDQQAANSIAELSNDEYWMFSQWDRMGRLRKRIDKVEVFIKYLEAEETREAEMFQVHETPSISGDLRRQFEAERRLVLRSAARNIA